LSWLTLRFVPSAPGRHVVLKWVVVPLRLLSHILGLRRVLRVLRLLPVVRLLGLLRSPVLVGMGRECRERMLRERVRMRVWFLLVRLINDFRLGALGVREIVGDAVALTVNSGTKLKALGKDYVHDSRLDLH